MNIERVVSGPCTPPFPLYSDLAQTLARAHQPPSGEGDRTIAHVLATCAGYAYSDADTVAMMMARIGLEGNACVRISQTVDAMLIFSTAYLVQSRCGRVVVLCYRGTEPGSLGNWLGDAEVGAESSVMSMADNGEPPMRIHAGFQLNVRATWLGVVEHLELALAGKSLIAPTDDVAHPLEALYVTGHSLGGAMALLFACSLAGRATHERLSHRLRAIYTFGQPMAVCTPIPQWTMTVSDRLFRYINTHDLVPALPPAAWGPFVHLGQEYRYADGAWHRMAGAVTQMRTIRDIPKALLAWFAPPGRRGASAYSVGDHAPQRYIAALRPKGMTTEFGD